MRPVIVAYLDASIRRMFAEVLHLEADWRGLQEYRVATTESAAETYQQLRASPEPMLALIGPRLRGGTILDLLRAVAEDPALQRHRYVLLDDFCPRDEAERREWEALSRRLGVGWLGLYRIDLERLFAFVDEA